MKDPVTKDQIVKSLDLLRTIIQEKVQLDHNDYGLCPFHEEKSKSFHIFLAASGRARFYCFGCGAQGDIFNYLRLADNLGFTSALFKLTTILEREITVELPQVSSVPRAPEWQTQNGPRILDFCEKDCQKYIDLRSDYYILLEENQNLRTKLDLPEFNPSNEGPK